MSRPDESGSSRFPVLLFLDVDGPLIPFGATPPEYPTYQLRLEPWQVESNPLLVRLNPAHGARLAALSCDLVWATTWMGDANELISPLIGLPQLPVVIWQESDNERRDHRLHWKTPDLVDWAAGRSFVWVDDEITDADRAWVAEHHRGDALLHRVDPRRGLTDEDFATVGEWLRTARHRR